MAGADLDGDGEPEPGRADLVQRNAADLRRQTRRTADLVRAPTPCSVRRCPCPGRGCIRPDRGWRARRRARSVPFRPACIFGSAKITDLPPPCGRPAAAFLSVIARASRNASSVLTSSAIRTPPMAGPQATLSIDDDGFEPRRRIVDVDDLDRAELVGEAEHGVAGRDVLVHGRPQSLRSRSPIAAARKRAASPPVTTR